MLFLNPEDFIESTLVTARRSLVRLNLKRAAHARLEADELIELRRALSRCVVFSSGDADSRVLYLRATDTSILVREITHGRVTTSYDIDCAISLRDMNLELAVLDGMICSMERRIATATLSKMSALHIRKGECQKNCYS